jgi:acetolactate synthase-1/2/3 large subunit
MKLYMDAHLARLFGGAGQSRAGPKITVHPPIPSDDALRWAAMALERAQRPLLLVGAQALLDTAAADDLAHAVDRLGLPVYLSGGARGLLGKGHPLQMRHQRRAALREADLVILAGVPCDFRLDYGRHIRRGATTIAANRSYADMTLNRRPNIAALGDPGLFLRRLALLAPQADRWVGWRAALAGRDDERSQEIARQAEAPSAHLNPIQLCREIEAALPDDSILVGDGGDFVATASYVISPRGPLRWLDPGPYGTLGVGAGFALGAKLYRPDAEVWALFGDGAFGYSIAELDTFARHGLAIICVVGNDASWTQIAREQGEMLGDLVGTELAATDYHRAAEGLGVSGLYLDDPELMPELLDQARSLARAGRPVLINARLGKTDFRKGSISV